MNNYVKGVPHYEVGDTVVYETFCGPRTVIITAKHADVKNGRPGFSGRNEGGTYWGYDYQVVRVR